MRYFFHIAYHGTRYCGWQRHPDGINVQQVIENSLGMLLKSAVNIVGCGRTDAQVHASQFFFHVDIQKAWDFELLFRLNKILPDDIAVFDIIPMEGLPHARFDAIQRTYDYFIHTYKDPFLSSFSSFYAYKNLDIDKMKAAVALLPKFTDYRGFCKSPDRNEHTICNISSATLFSSASGDKLRLQISANRFLSRMIRIIVGRLLEIGKCEMSVDEFEHYLSHQQTPPIIIPAYPQGLYLSRVVYPYLDIPQRPSFSPLEPLGNLRQWLTV